MKTCELCEKEKPDVRPRFYDLSGGAGDGVSRASGTTSGTVDTCDKCDRETQTYDSDSLLRLDKLLRERS